MSTVREVAGVRAKDRNGDACEIVFLEAHHLITLEPTPRAHITPDDARALANILRRLASRVDRRKAATLVEGASNE